MNNRFDNSKTRILKQTDPTSLVRSFLPFGCRSVKIHSRIFLLGGTKTNKTVTQCSYSRHACLMRQNCHDEMCIQLLAQQAFVTHHLCVHIDYEFPFALNIYTTFISNHLSSVPKRPVKYLPYLEAKKWQSLRFQHNQNKTKMCNSRRSGLTILQSTGLLTSYPPRARMEC